MLCEKYGLAHISTGELFRSEIASKSPLGLKVEGFVNKGNLVPDEVVVEIVAGKLESLESGWLLDGFPRTLRQAEELDRYLATSGKRIDFVLLLSVSEEVVIKRLAGRGREDDSDATVRKRLMVFRDLTQPLAAYYRGHGLLQEFDGAPSEDQVSSALTVFLEESAAKSGS